MSKFLGLLSCFWGQIFFENTIASALKSYIIIFKKKFEIFLGGSEKVKKTAFLGLKCHCNYTVGYTVIKMGVKLGPFSFRFLEVP